jgi:hypothetical protein
MLKDILSYGIGTFAAFAVLAVLAFVFIRDITQEYFRQYFFAGDRDEMPFNRATRGWVYRPRRTKAARSGSALILRIVQASGQSVALNMLYPYPEPKAKMKVA